jgi:hypothetical protein
MNRKRIFLVTGLTLAVCFAVSWNVLSATKNKFNVELEIQRNRAYGEIQNVIAAHTYCYEAQQQVYEFENFWSKRDDIAYSGNNGRKAAMDYYAASNAAARKAKLKYMSELYPNEVKNVPENEGIGDMVIHLLTTPYIVVAGDGKTAQGLWYVPSVNCEIDKKGEPSVNTIWEKCFVDFIYEDGAWKIWHFTQWVQFANGLDKSLVDGSWKHTRFNQPAQASAQPAQAQQQPKDTLDQTYSTKRVAAFRPEMPKAYDTWKDSMAAVRSH